MRAVDGQVVGFQPTPNYDAFIWQNPDSVTGDEPARDVANKALKLFDEEKYHDIDVETGSMILSDNPLLAHPFRNSQVIPLLFPLSAYLTGSGDPLTPFLACVPRDKRCVTSLSYAAGSTSRRAGCETGCARTRSGDFSAHEAAKESPRSLCGNTRNGNPALFSTLSVGLYAQA